MLYSAWLRRNDDAVHMEVDYHDKHGGMHSSMRELSM